MLRMVYEDSTENMHGRLWEAVHTGLVFRSDDAYRFLHDRVQEAAYALIPEGLRAAAHLRIGRLLAAHTPLEKREEGIFEIVNQLNRGAALLTSRDEREDLAGLNLIAGQRAKTSTAYTSALTYLAAGAALLAEDAWERRHELTFALELNRAACEFLTGALAAVEERLDALATRAATTVEHATVSCLRMDVCTTLGQSGRAIAAGLDYLRRVGIDWSPHPAEADVRREYERIWAQLGGRTIEELIELPLMSDPVALGTLDVLTKLVRPAALTNRNLEFLTVCQAVNLSLERGNSDGSCFAYARLGVLAGPHFGNYQAGLRFGQLGYELIEHRGLRRFQAMTYLTLGSAILSRTSHVRAGRELVRRAFEAANKSGDLTSAAYCCNILNVHLLAEGDPLAETQREAENGLAFAQKMQFGFVIDIISTQLGLIRTLRGLTRKFGSLDDEQFDELRIERRFADNPDRALGEWWYWIRKLQARYLAGDYAAAVEASSQVHRLQWALGLEAAELHFYGALSHAACCDSAAADQRQPHVEALAAHHRQLALWAEHGPEHFENRAALVGAEIARVEGRPLEAMDLYERAIHSARANGFVHHEALAHELAGRFALQRGLETAGAAHLRHARACYALWGADGKVRHLEQLYPQLGKEDLVPGPTSTIGAPVEHLDLATVLKVSQAVSGEIVLDKLLDTLMRTALAHAGAARGLLMLPRGEELRVEAEATLWGETVTLWLREAREAALPESVLHYVVRTQERVILDDAAAQNPFSADAYLRQTHARSILCLPLVKQARLVGVLYLENNLTSHVFTPARIAVLQLLASQAAISLENALLYTEVREAEGRVRQQERELRQLIDFVPQSIFAALGPKGSFLYTNQVALEYCGLSAEDFRAPDIVKRVFHPDDVERFVDQRQRGLKRKTLSELEARILRKDGQYRWFLIRYNPLRDDWGQITRWYVTATDIEDRKQAEERFRNENVALREELDQASMFEEIVGASPILQAVLARVAKVAPTDSTVLITGETGTGKELIARAIHKRSARAARTFVSVNCAAIPPSLIAAELFGHEKGAFTGAVQRRLGRFELAEGGTLFLDEIGDLPAETQVALLRVLQEHEFERVGGTRVLRADVRVIAATNRDLPAAVAAGTFRSDLFYRLNVFPLEVPPLRERRQDIPVLVEYFLDRYASKAGKKIRGINKKTLELLQAYRWPGNIRELQNVIERSVIVCETETFSVDASWLAAESQLTSPASQPLAETLVAQEKTMIEAALAECRGRVAGPGGAAARLGIPPSTLENKIRALKINKHRFKPL